MEPPHLRPTLEGQTSCRGCPWGGPLRVTLSSWSHKNESYDNARWIYGHFAKLLLFILLMSRLSAIAKIFCCIHFNAQVWPRLENGDGLSSIEGGPERPRVLHRQREMHKCGFSHFSLSAQFMSLTAIGISFEVSSARHLDLARLTPLRALFLAGRWWRWAPRTLESLDFHEWLHQVSMLRRGFFLTEPRKLRVFWRKRVINSTACGPKSTQTPKTWRHDTVAFGAWAGALLRMEGGSFNWY